MDNSSCRSFIIGLHNSYVQECRPQKTLAETWTKCNSYKAWVGDHWLKMFASFWPKSNNNCAQPLFVYRLYNQTSFSKLHEDLQTGKLDFYGTSVTLTDRESSLYRTTSGEMNVQYFFYANMAESDHDHDQLSALAQAAFLTGPFQTPVWCCVLALISIGILLQWRIDNLDRQLRGVSSSIPSRLFQLSLLTPLMTLGVVYCSLLKAMVITSGPKAAFRSLDELADRLSRRELQIVLETGLSRRYDLLTDESLAISDGMRRVVRQIAQTPGALRVMENIDQVCAELRRSSNILFLGFDHFSTCVDLCYWKTTLAGVPDAFAVFILPKNTSAKVVALANLASFPAGNYADIRLRRQFRRDCFNGRRITNVLNLNSLLYAFLLLAFGQIVAGLLLAVEIRTFVDDSCRRFLRRNRISSKCVIQY